jgi:hypothetical protein
MKSHLAFLFIASLVTFNLQAATSISKKKINGPECTAHLMSALNIKSEEAYQICSSHNEEVKLCLIQNRQLGKKELLKKCHQK